MDIPIKNKSDYHPKYFIVTTLYRQYCTSGVEKCRYAHEHLSKLGPSPVKTHSLSGWMSPKRLLRDVELTNQVEQLAVQHVKAREWLIRIHLKLKSLFMYVHTLLKNRPNLSSLAQTYY